MKKGYWARIRALILALSIFTCSFTFDSKEVKAATNMDYNQVYTVAVSAKSPQTLTFQTPSTGYTRVEVKVSKVTTSDGEVTHGSDMDCGVYVDGKMLMYDLVGQDDGVVATENYAFAPGQEGKVELSCNILYGWIYYCEVKVVNETPANFETEDNDTIASSDSLKVKKVHSGILNDRDDDDWYVFKAPKAGKYQILVQNTDDSRTGDFFYVQGFKKKNKTDSNFKYTSAKAGKGWVKSKKISLKKGKKYSVRISDALNKSIPYEIKVKKVH